VVIENHDKVMEFHQLIMEFLTTKLKEYSGKSIFDTSYYVEVESGTVENDLWRPWKSRENFFREKVLEPCQCQEVVDECS